MKKIHCLDDHGSSFSVPADSVTFRPAIFGVLFDDDKVLLARNEVTGLWHPPGRMLADYETPSRALVQYFRSVTGSIPATGPLLLVEEQYRIDQNGRPWHLSVLYYALDMDVIATPVQLSEDEMGQPKLVPFQDLQRSQMQFGFDAVQAGRLQLELMEA